MTLIVGVKCDSGIVVASDGSISSTTIEQKTKKLSVIDGCVVIGTSGPVGLGQRFAGELECYWRGNSANNKTPATVMTELAEIFRKHIILDATVSKQLSGLVANTYHVWSSETVVAMPVSGRACLFRFDQHGAPIEHTEDLPFVSVGSGQFTGDPFLAFNRRVLWKDTLPDLSKGIFSTMWTLRHAIETSPGGVAEPIQVVILRDRDGTTHARELDESELAEHRESIKMVEKGLADKAFLLEADAPPPPSLSSKKKIRSLD